MQRSHEGNINRRGWETKAKDIPIEDVYNLWLIKYGNEPVFNSIIAELPRFDFECGRRLYDAGMLISHKNLESYILKTKEEIDADH